MQPRGNDCFATHLCTCRMISRCGVRKHRKNIWILVTLNRENKPEDMEKTLKHGDTMLALTLEVFPILSFYIRK